VDRKKLESINFSIDFPFWLGFNYFPKLGPLRFKLLLEYFGSAKRAWEACAADFRKIGLRSDLTEEFLRHRNSFSFENIQKLLKEKRIIVLTWMDKDYPERLRNIEDSPPVIYLKTYMKRKDISNFWKSPAVGVVGTRRVTNYGRQVTEKLISGLVDNKVTIISGMAKGVDGIAHRTAINKEGKTVAVLGSGVDVLYPQQSRDIYANLSYSDRGMIVSDFPPGTLPDRKIFPLETGLLPDFPIWF